MFESGTSHIYFLWKNQVFIKRSPYAKLTLNIQNIEKFLLILLQNRKIDPSVFFTSFFGIIFTQRNAVSKTFGLDSFPKNRMFLKKKFCDRSRSFFRKN
ncbi:hypothetical protein LEP1GSC170_2243 [Leptospira interrogans serovar Bataviae str. HAI135]|nr:hypothetical protein LEP1GSC170_2243 [Leptospira interrogans serovar Bataviae str. HAI135]